MNIEHYFKTYYANETQNIINRLPKHMIINLSLRFKEWWTDQERKLYTKGKRKFPLPCDRTYTVDQIPYDRSDPTTLRYPRLNRLLKEYKYLTSIEIAELLKEDPMQVRSYLFHAVRRGEIISEELRKSKTVKGQRTDVKIYYIPQNKFYGRSL